MVLRMTIIQRRKQGFDPIPCCMFYDTADGRSMCGTERGCNVKSRIAYGNPGLHACYSAARAPLSGNAIKATM